MFRQAGKEATLENESEGREETREEERSVEEQRERERQQEEKVSANEIRRKKGNVLEKITERRTGAGRAKGRERR